MSLAMNVDLATARELRARERARDPNGPPLWPLNDEVWTDGRSWERPRLFCRIFGHVGFLVAQRGWYFLRCRRCRTRSQPELDPIDALIAAGPQAWRHL